MFSEKKFIVAVSGGVDSVVLLHKLASNKPDKVEYYVAHFDHGIRADSHLDAELVRKLAREYDLQFFLGEGHLGADTSEATAREARYKFLRELKDKFKAEKIITAHHEDDLIETIVINIVRGTGPRGLMPMSGLSDILRPFLNKTKKDIIEYAKEHDLEWIEDSTNSNEDYLRNYIRKNILEKLDSIRPELLSTRRKLEELYTDIDMRVLAMLPAKNLMYRPFFVGLSYIVQKELIRGWLVNNGVKDLDTATIEKVVIAAKTLPHNKQIDIKDGLVLKSQKMNILLSSS